MDNIVIEILKTINQIPGFDPASLVRPLKNNPEKAYLHLAEREAWFRLKFPEGKIKIELLKLESDTAIARCTIYPHQNSDENAYLSQSIGAFTKVVLPDFSKFPVLTDMPEFKDNPDFAKLKEMTTADIIEFACSHAESRALKAAGFSTQTALAQPTDVDDDASGPSDTPADGTGTSSNTHATSEPAAIQAPALFPKSQPSTEPVKESTEDSKEGEAKDSVKRGRKKSVKEPKTAGNEVADETQPDQTAEAATQERTDDQTASNLVDLKAADVSSQEKPEIPDMSEVTSAATFDGFMKQMDLNEAKEVVITCLKREDQGKGKSFGWAMENNPRAITWIAENINKEKYPKEAAAAAVIIEEVRRMKNAG